MTDPSPQAEYAVGLAGGLADAGVEAAFISPGSRNTPLTLALANEPRINDISVLDERSGGFVALGNAKATGRPAVVVCTSGSAAAHYFPAIVEANQSSTPLIALTADRPVRLRGTGAPQTMDQVDLYGSHAKSFVDLDATEPSRARDDALELVEGAMSTPAGPVHANIPFDDRLVPESAIPPAASQPVEGGYETVGRVFDIPEHLEGREVMIVVGGRGGAALSDTVNRVADRLAAPVFADVQSNVKGPNVLRHGSLVVPAHDRGGDLLALRAHPPDVVLRLGPIPTAAPMWRWLESSGVEQILVDASRLSDPLGSATTTIQADPVRALEHFDAQASTERTFLDAWLAMDRTAGIALDASITTLPFPNEPAIAMVIASSVPDNSYLFVGSSRPIRDIESFGTHRSGVTVIANRGVNGIDGAISTALGASLTGVETTAFIGDITALHDISALAEAAALGASLRVVVVNNDGGGIFSFLPQATSDAIAPTIYERHWGTPHGLEIASIARSMGLSARVITTSVELAEALSAPIETPELIEIVTDRSANIEHHRVVRMAVASALADAD